MLTAILLGVLLSIVNILSHAVSMTFLIRLLKSNAERFRQRFGDLKVFSLTAVWLLMTHTFHSAVWGTTYLLTAGKTTFEQPGDAFYFSAVTFTTLGYGDIVIEGKWRMLCACQAMTGLLIFGWSTALFFSLVSRVWAIRFEPDSPADKSNASQK